MIKDVRDQINEREKLGKIKVLVEHENNVTTLFRQEKTRGELGQTDATQEDFLKPCRYAPEDKAITRDGFFARTAAMDFGLDLNAPHSMGTTIIGVTYNGGVVLGADSRTSTGMYVANRASDKITQLTDNVYLCRSGSVVLLCTTHLRNAFDGELDPLANLFTRLEVGTIEVEEGNHVFGNEILIAADSQIISDYVRYFLHQHTIQLGQPATVKVAANLVRMLSYNNKDMLEAGLIVGGWDKYEGGKIYGVPLGGTILELPFALGGMVLILLKLDEETKKDSVIGMKKSPSHVVLPKFQRNVLEEPEIINVWELMEDLEDEIPLFDSSQEKPQITSFPTTGKENKNRHGGLDDSAARLEPNLKQTEFESPCLIRSLLHSLKEDYPMRRNRSRICYLRNPKSQRPEIQSQYLNHSRKNAHKVGKMPLEELRMLMGKKEVRVPVVFVKGRLIGGADEVVQMEEEGKLGILFNGIPRGLVGCGGGRFVMCMDYNGS
ncbi:hypothetical protein HHK36_006487 [Tetracentron sinense]|uniref:Uncharacterized protein n=2 Tax=Magnoliopsida TaxID=3398 RepID=A0A835DP82_TETSI|nr:hypothetical protein HHK36_006487 [Tetracentron sinense]